MPKNLEIKCRINNAKELSRLIQASGNYERSTEKQTDIYYKVRIGRLKLRIINNDYGNLIHYNREEKSTSRVSDYIISRTDNFKELDKILRSLYVVKVIVSKTREIYVTKNIRIHLDRVKGLGNFLEIEIIIDKIAEARKTLKELISKLELSEREFIKNSYSDLLISK